MAKKFIDAETAYRKINGIGGCDALPDTWADGWDKAIDECLNILENQPAADVQEVRHGEWKERMSCSSSVKCSVCGNSHEYETTYCPNCGARMDGDPNA